MSQFIVPSNRDACATIRGYVYQVDLTIDRWLRLQPGQTLELERGEDIDIVQALTSPEEEQTRVLEQVKNSPRSLTLRSQDAVEAIANSIQHRADNPGLDLFFQFTTIAPPGKERLSPFPRTPGIEVWESISSGAMEPDQLKQALVDIREVLKGASRPSRIGNSTWQTYCTFLREASEEDLRELICRFQWSTNAEPSDEIARQTRSHLIETRQAADLREAQQKYERLFLYVFKLLSLPGLKRLCLEDRDRELALPVLGESDSKLLEVVAQVRALSERMSATEQDVSRLKEDIQQLARKSGIDVTVTYALETPVLSMPPAVATAAPRVSAVKEIREGLVGSAWLNLHGGTGTGKTQLAILAVQEIGTCRAWIGFRGLAISQACLRLDSALSILAGKAVAGSPDELCHMVSAELPNGSLVVLDDLPRISGEDELSQRLIRLAQDFARRGLKLLSNSAYPIPSKVTEQLEGTIRQAEVPPFTDDDVMEVLRSYGAPAGLLTPRFVKFLNALGQGHPTLLTAMARYMRQQSWQFTDESLRAILVGSYSRELSDDVVARLLETVEDRDSRELLYRLNLVLASFSVDDADALAAVAPQIVHPRERLHTLMGLWVQEDPGDRFSLSPLVKRLGIADLSSETKKDCHALLAQRIIQKGRLNQLDAVDTWLHLFQAEDYDRAALMLGMALLALAESGAKADDCGLLLIWTQTQPLPRNMNVGLRLFLRTAQVTALRKYGRDYSFALDDINAILPYIDETHVLGLITASVHLTIAIGDSDPSRVHSYLKATLPLLGRCPMDLGKLFPEPMRPEVLIWSAVHAIRTRAQLKEWIELVSSLSPAQRSIAFASDVAEDASMMIANHLWLSEIPKPEHERDWPSVLVATDELSRKADAWRQELLWCCAVRARMIIVAEYEHNLEDARNIAAASLERASPDPRVRFLLADYIGRQLFWAKDSVALKWLLDAASQETTCFPLIRVNCLLYVAAAISSQSPNEAIVYATKAVALAKNNVSVPECELAKALSELAVAHWVKAGPAAAFEPWDAAGQHVFACKENTVQWKARFVLYGHITGYFSALAETGKPPTFQDGSSFSPPYPGVFLTEDDRRAARYDDVYGTSGDEIVIEQLVRFAEAVQNTERATFWALRGSEMAEKGGNAQVGAILSPYAIYGMLQCDKLEDAVRVALSASVVLNVSRKEHEEGRKLPQTVATAEAILAPKPSAQWNVIENNAVTYGLLPVMIHLSSISIEDQARAAHLGGKMASFCRRTMETASDRALWQNAAELFELIFAYASPAKDIVQRGNACAPNESLRAIAYIGASIQQDVPLDRAFRLHVAAIGYLLDNCFQSAFQVFRPLLLTPFVCSYWSNVFARTRFRFSTPQMVEKELNAAIQEPEPRRIRRVLEVVALGLTATLKPGEADWLQTKP